MSKCKPWRLSLFLRVWRQQTRSLPISLYIYLCTQEPRLRVLPCLHGAVAQSAAKRKDASYADFLEEVLKGECDTRQV